MIANVDVLATGRHDLFLRELDRRLIVDEQGSGIGLSEIESSKKHALGVGCEVFCICAGACDALLSMLVADANVVSKGLPDGCMRKEAGEG